jgi:hypothetical protein
MRKHSPYRNQAGGKQSSGSSALKHYGQANTDSEIYQSQNPSIHARSGPTGIGSGIKNVNTNSKAALEKMERERAAQLEVESQKKAVLDKLNKIQSKKF